MNESQIVHDHKTMIGGSEIGAICGVSNWASPLQIYHKKVGTFPPEPANENMYWGSKKEPIVREAFAERLNCHVIHNVPLIRDKKHPFLGAHVDGLVAQEAVKGGLVSVISNEYSPDDPSVIKVIKNATAIFEAKTSNEFAADDFGQTGSDKVPDSYNLQAQQYMYVVEKEVTWFGVLIGSSDFRWFKIERDEDMIKDMIEVAKDFWRRVELKDPPPPEAIDEGLLRRLYPGDVGTEIEADESATSWMAKLKEAKRLEKIYKTEIGLCKNNLIEIIGDNSKLVGENFHINYKKNKDGIKINWPAIAKEINISEDIIEKHSTVTKGSRGFLPVWKD